MKLFDLISIHDKEVLASNSKIHLAGWNGVDNPLDVYLGGKFEEWQSWQTKRNFERKFITSLIQLPQSNKWLFAGVFESFGCEFKPDSNLFKYKTAVIGSLDSLAGRVIVEFKRSGRNSYLLAENWTDSLNVSEVLSEKMVVNEFSAYSETSIDKATLDIIVQQDIPSWKTALSAVSGVYLITDTHTGKLYVGSATGEGGFWQRWREYSASGHGHNKELKRLLAEQGHEYASHFQYSILEIADTHTSPNIVISRESYWKSVLCSRLHGYNSN